VKIRHICTLLVAGLLLSANGFRVSSKTVPRRLLIFAVWPGEKGKQPDAPILDPIAILEGVKFDDPVKPVNSSEPQANANYDRFVKDYFQKDQKYPFLFGGSSKGTIAVEGAVGISCETLTATVKTPVPFVNAQKALAVSSLQGLGLHENWRKPASAEERTEFLRLAANFLEKQGVANISVSTIRLDNLRSTKLGVDRPEALVGSVLVKTKTAVRYLFMVAERKNAKWDAILTSYHVGKDLEDGVDNVEEDFVDQLDLFKNGVDVIVTICSYYESWDYTIYREEDGTWKKVYQGGGGGC
jgi:hypothetical protein